MKPEFPAHDQDKAAAPHEQAVEFALILSRMINTVKDDPSQMRLAIYEFARARLKIDASWADEAERTRLLSALETAIRGVEQFSARDTDRLHAPTPSVQIGISSSQDEPPARSVVEIHRPEPPPRTVAADGTYSWAHSSPVLEFQARRLLSAPSRYWIGTTLFIAVAGFAIYTAIQQTSALRGGMEALAVAKPAAPAPVPPQPQSAAPDAKTAVAPTQPFPLPNDYGVYALSNNGLSELHLLPEQVPDKRVAISTPIGQSSSTVLPDGKAKFVVFRRDLAGNTPDRIEVRVVARVVRALKFDAKGKPSFSPVSDAWNMRNLSYEFRVRPIAGNPEMLLVQPEHADFTLPAGRYALVLRSQGYDFTIAGQVTDLAQCLERTDAANGTFYSDCQKP
ncbi:hypothetical protein [Bradyrhizobium sp. sBnM-33]|uniref:hypothetical protein n=1 Tax=Bradyrhizobium sp. sBnM-33 TaxID=2831780 RepID=UPI001BD11224|nr:hypothetical protein [Bradyrhizobium sp. sBnM-33]WOH53642.1 hypothetical protein RX328_17080 [Bradyrhizobium sp. sBnM-33]